MKHEIYNLIELAKNGDKKALEILVSENSGLIHSAVARFTGRGVESEDLFQIGAIGLIKSINKFDTSYDVCFSTYAFPMIIGEIRRFLRDDSIIKVSRTLKEQATKAYIAGERIASEKGRDATISEISAFTGISESQLILSMEACRKPESIYKVISDEGTSPMLLMDKLPSDEKTEEKIISNIALRDAIKKLPPRERQILNLRYYKEKSQSYIADVMGLSQVQISRIEKKILKSLRENVT